MKHPAFTTVSGSMLFVGLFILAGGLMSLCLLGLTTLPLGILILQGGLSGMFFCGLVVLLWYITKYTRLNGNTFIQRVINHAVLFGILVLIWQGCEHLFLYLLFKQSVYQQLLALIPSKIVCGLLLFTLVIQYYSISALNQHVDDSEDEDVDEDTPIQHEQISTELDKQTESVFTHEKITVKSGSNIHLIPFPELMYIQAEGDYVVLYTAVGRHIKEETMKNLESQLPSNFLRIHRSCIVNTENISRIELYEKQHYLITLKSGQQVRASQNGYKLLKERMRL